MDSIIKSNLGRRILLLVLVSTLLMLAGLTISGWLAVRQSSERVFRERQALAQSTANYLDYILRQNLARLDSFRFAAEVDITDSDLEPEKRALHSIYLGSIFDGVFITNEQGSVLWAEPYRSDFVNTNISDYAPIWQSLANKRPYISNVMTIRPGVEKVIFMVSLLRNNEGKIVGLVSGRIDPTGRALQEVIQLVELGKTSYIDVIDSNGMILTSSDLGRVLRNGKEVNQGKAEVEESAPLSVASWSVAVRQSEAEALAPVHSMAQRFIIFGLASMITALFLGWGMARSLVLPIGQLTASVQRISRGDLSQPIPKLSKDEIGELGQSFDSMRIELKKSLEEIQQWNRALEAKVEERTRQLDESYREIERKEADRGRLLQKVLTVQEEERKRIARELHDETTQSLVGLLMRLEALMVVPNITSGDTRNMLVEMKNLAVRTIDNVHKIIFDLRPSVLDDLGLLPAIRWYTENRLGAQGIEVRIEVTGEEMKLPPQVEIALFRVVQEAITNIIKHAGANNVVVSVELTPSTIGIEIEDDGKGFDLNAINSQADKIQGIGLLGMRERITLISGKFNITSQPGGGTRIAVEVALD